MPVRFCIPFAAWCAVAIPAAAQPTAAELLAKARAAFESNVAKENRWNWKTTQMHVLRTVSGVELRRLPDVTVESVIRQDGRRCNAVTSWGDGVAPYKLDADADTRCGGQDPVDPPLRVEALLAATNARLIDPHTVAIRHDRAHMHDAAPEVRCTASVEGTIRLDPETNFPARIEGKLVDTGCESETWSELHYDGDPVKLPSRRGLFKGTQFRLEFQLQSDKYGNPANSFWITTAQHWYRPFSHIEGIIYFNRRFAINMANAVWITDSETVAQEFGVQSQTRFDIK